MDQQDHQSHPGEEHYYTQPPYSQKDKITHQNMQSPGRSLPRIFIVVTSILMVVVIVLSIVVVHLLTNPASKLSTATSLSPTTSTKGNSATPVVTPTPTATPIPTATPLPPNTVLCSSSTSTGWNGWALFDGWEKTPDGYLVRVLRHFLS